MGLSSSSSSSTSQKMNRKNDSWSGSISLKRTGNSLHQISGNGRYWDEYIDAYQDLFNHTSTEWAPWYIIPADTKWLSRLAVAGIIHQTLSDLNLAYPVVSEEAKKELLVAKKELENEDNSRSAEKDKKKKNKKRRK